MPQKKGFACISPERRREIAGKGGKAAHARGVAHRFTSEEAKAARKLNKSAHKYTSEEAREAGRKGGLKRVENRKRKMEAAGNQNTPPAVVPVEPSGSVSTAV